MEGRSYLCVNDNKHACCRYCTNTPSVDVKPMRIGVPLDSYPTDHTSSDADVSGGLTAGFAWASREAERCVQRATSKQAGYQKNKPYNAHYDRYSTAHLAAYQQHADHHGEDYAEIRSIVPTLRFMAESLWVVVAITK